MRNTKGQFAKGNKGKPKGSSNKSTAKVKEFFAKVFEENKEQFELDLKELEPRERVKAMLEIAPYLSPKLKAVEMNIDHANRDIQPVTITLENE